MVCNDGIFRYGGYVGGASKVPADIQSFQSRKILRAHYVHVKYGLHTTPTLFLRTQGPLGGLRETRWPTPGRHGGGMGRGGLLKRCRGPAGRP